MAVNNEFASEVERLYKAEEVALEQHESQTTRIKELQHKLAKQSQAATNNVEEEKLNLELQIRQLKMCLENEKSENNKLRSDKQRVELDSSSREEVSIGILSDIFYFCFLYVEPPVISPEGHGEAERSVSRHGERPPAGEAGEGGWRPADGDVEVGVT